MLGVVQTCCPAPGLQGAASLPQAEVGGPPGPTSGSAAPTQSLERPGGGHRHQAGSTGAGGGERRRNGGGTKRLRWKRGVTAGVEVDREGRAGAAAGGGD